MNNNTMMLQEATRAAAAAAHWTKAEDMIFEKALVTVPENLLDRWEKIAERIPGKTAADVMHHYEILILDLMDIEAGRVKLPDYSDDYENSVQSVRAKQAEAEKKKGSPWSEEEHRYGKGDWRSISRNVVVTRTPTQVASHAQKYFLRQNSARRDRKRSSIHDITTVDGGTPSNMPVDQNRVPSPGGSAQQPIPPPDGLAQPGNPPMMMQQMAPGQQYPNQGVRMGHPNYGFNI